MTTTAPRKCIRVEPPALLTEPLNVTLQVSSSLGS